MDTDHYAFLVFPSHNNVRIFKDKQRIYPTDIILDRAVTAQYQELESTSTGVIIDEGQMGYVATEELSFIPPQNAPEFIQKWESTLPLQGYTRAEYSTRPVSSARQETVFTLVDDNHVRSHTYTYTTEGDKLLQIKPVHLKTPWPIMVKLIYIFYAEVALLVTLLIICRKK